jgi:hypothetical protein
MVLWVSKKRGGGFLGLITFLWSLIQKETGAEFRKRIHSEAGRKVFVVDFLEDDYHKGKFVKFNIRIPSSLGSSRIFPLSSENWGMVALGKISHSKPQMKPPASNQEHPFWLDHNCRSISSSWERNLVESLWAQSGWIGTYNWLFNLIHDLGWIGCHFIPTPDV